MHADKLDIVVVCWQDIFSCVISPYEGLRNLLFNL